MNFHENSMASELVKSIHLIRSFSHTCYFIGFVPFILIASEARKKEVAKFVLSVIHVTITMYRNNIGVGFKAQ